MELTYFVKLLLDIYEQQPNRNDFEEKIQEGTALFYFFDEENNYREYKDPGVEVRLSEIKEEEKGNLDNYRKRAVQYLTKVAKLC
jgi:hypothetical protein